jgi:hypothetical protein
MLYFCSYFTVHCCNLVYFALRGFAPYVHKNMDLVLDIHFLTNEPSKEENRDDIYPT